MAERLELPWSEEQVAALNQYQRGGQYHPFTCGGDRSDDDHVAYAAAHGEDNGQLVATKDGWVCPVCGYRQTWTHAFMAT